MAADMETQVVENREHEPSGCDSAEAKSVSLTTKMIKHPLEHTWTLWFFKQDSNKSWEESQMTVASFNTVEDFWALYNHIELASKLKPGCDYSLFKEGIKPMWEDTFNKQGGRWLISLSRQQRALELDHFWLEMLMLLIGEGFEEFSNQVCGAVVNIRPRADKVAIWTGESSNTQANMKIGQTWKRRLNIPENIQLQYQSHAATAGSNKSSMASVMYTV